MRKLLIIPILTLLLLTGCSKIDILKPEIKINDVGFYPAKIQITKIGNEEHIEYRVTNYRSVDILVDLDNRKPDYVTEGYDTYNKETNIYLIIPERHFMVKSGETYITEIVVGKPKDIEINDTEMWVSMKASRKSEGLISQVIELNSRILIKGVDK